MIVSTDGKTGETEESVFMDLISVTGKIRARYRSEGITARRVNETMFVGNEGCVG